MLHPRHKLNYFKIAGWEQEWIDAAEAIVRLEYARSYAVKDVGTQGGANEVGEVEEVDQVHC